MAKGGQKRKKNPGVGIDFKRAKHKVGRAVKKGPNDTSVAFRSHAINLPSQSVAEDRAGVAVSSHNLTLKELLVQSGHYSERSRAAGISGLKDLLERYPGQCRRSTADLLEALAPRISDSDGSVRKALLELLISQVLPEIGPEGMRPFLALLMAHICSAMTSLSEGIRTDALAFLAAVVEAAPAAVAGVFTQPALEHFGHLLSSGQRGASIRARSLLALSKVVTGLLSFLCKISGHEPSDHSAASHPRADTSQLLPHGTAAATRADGEAAVLAGRPLMWCNALPPPAPVIAVYQSAMAKLQNPRPIDDVVSSGPVDEPSTAAAQLVARLLDAFGECSPSTLRTSPELLSSDCASDILKSIALLLPLIRNAEARREVEAALPKRIAPHFPVTLPAVAPSVTLRASLSSFNLASAQLLAALLETHQGGRQGAPTWAKRLVAFYSGVLSKGTALPSHDDEDGSRRAPAQLSTESVEQVLAGIQAVLPHVSQEDQGVLLASVGGLSQRLPAKSAARAACLKLQHRLLAAFTRRTHSASEAQWAFLSEADVATWVQALPRLLWELGDTTPGVSSLALQLLLDASRSAAPSGTLSCTLQALQPQLVPLLCLLATPPRRKAAKVQPSASGTGIGGSSSVPARASNVEAAPKLVIGVLAKLSPQCQEVAVDLLSFQGRLDETTLRAIAMLALTSAYPASIATRAVAIAAALAQEQAAQLPPPPGAATEAAAASASAYHSMVGALLQGGMANVSVDDSWHRHVAIVNAACSTLTCVDMAGKAAGQTWTVLEPLLLQRLATGTATGDSPHRRLYGFLRGAATAIAAAAPPHAGCEHVSLAHSRCLSCLESGNSGTCRGDILSSSEGSAGGSKGGDRASGMTQRIDDDLEAADGSSFGSLTKMGIPRAAPSQALKEALPVLMWQYNAWYVSAGQQQDRSAGRCGADAFAAVSQPLAGGAAKGADVAAADDAASSPGVQPILSLLCLVPSMLQPLLHVMGSAVKDEPLLSGAKMFQPLQGGVHQSSLLQGGANVSLALLQALLEDRRLTRHVLDHISDVEAVITAASVAGGGDSGTISAARTAERLQLAKNTASALFGL